MSDEKPTAENKTTEALTWFDHGVLDKALRKPRSIPDYLDDAEGAEWLRGYDSAEVANGRTRT